MIVLNEITKGGAVRPLELWPEDVLDVTSVPGAPTGAHLSTIDGRRFTVAEGVAEVFAMLDEADDE
jgi:hypothetical protein